MKRQQLCRAMMAALVLSSAAILPAMAEEITSSITNDTNNGKYSESVSVHPSNNSSSAIDLGNRTSGVNVDIKTTGEGNGIALESTSGDGINIAGTHNDVKLAAENGDVTVTADGSKSYGIFVQSAGSGNDITLSGNSTSITGGQRGVYIYGSDTTLTMTANTGNNTVSGSYSAIYVQYNTSGGGETANARLSFNAEGSNIISSTGAASTIYLAQDNTELTLEAGEDNVFRNTGNSSMGLYVSKDATISMTAGNNNSITANSAAINVESSPHVEIEITAGNNNTITSANNAAIFMVGGSVSNEGNSILSITANNGSNIVSGSSFGIRTSSGDVTLTAEKGKNSITATGGSALYVRGNTTNNDPTAYSEGTATLKAQENEFTASNYGVYVSGSDAFADVIATSGNNTVNAGGSAVASYGSGTVTLDAEESNVIQGQNGGSATIGIEAYKDGKVILTAKDKNVISADARGVYASGGTVAVDGALNYLGTTGVDDRVVAAWALAGGTIEMSGATQIVTAGLSDSIAVAAGEYDATEAEHTSAVTILYDDYTDALGDVYTSAIAGAITSGAGGMIDIQQKSGSTASLTVAGDVEAANGGVVSLNLGEGGSLLGRADNYAAWNDTGHSGSFESLFSGTAASGGTIDLTMGNEAAWYLTGQSWVSSLTSDNAYIDLVSLSGNSSANALSVGSLNGGVTFNMHLSSDRSASDMLYLGQASGSFLIQVTDLITAEDMYADGFSGLRFATVGSGSDVTFRAVTLDQGVMDIEYEIGTDAYDTSSENNAYNSIAGHGAGGTDKPGTEWVDSFVGSGATNYKLIDKAYEELSGAGRTVLSMSRANYANAVYMDRLNKRQGEARYIEGDEGLWVRLRHDRIGKSAAFRSKNTMFELGYDRKVDESSSGEHRRGAAIDYMRGTTDYKTVNGDGDTTRAGLWAYDTWLGDKGHYRDIVFKAGRLSNEFDIYTPYTGQKVHGDYDNFVLSLSAEYGRKKELGSGWYIEPQVQLQYAHVTDADYTTSQGTQVEAGDINSLIGRAGFRLGRDLGEKTTFYVKADILHEFLGDQDIRAWDNTGVFSTTYENEGTWYDIGLGIAREFGRGRYFFLDLEKSMGNDHSDTYQINVGVSVRI